jgi:hypothetical protein
VVEEEPVVAVDQPRQVQVEDRADKQVIMEQGHNLVEVHKVQAVLAPVPTVLLVVQH